MYQEVNRYCANALARRAPGLARLIVRHKIAVKYLFAGGAAVAVNLSVLYVFTDLFGVWYVGSSVIAFCVSLATGFSLQKFWTFRDGSMRHIKRQMVMYTAVGVLNVILGPTLLYLVVETFGIWYLTAQFLVMAALAVESYFLNRFITFKKDAAYEGVDALN